MHEPEVDIERDASAPAANGPRSRPGGRGVHLAKTVTWRFVATGTTFVISYAVTGSVAIGATIGGIEAFAKMVLYYGHERAWARLTAPAGS